MTLYATRADQDYVNYTMQIAGIVDAQTPFANDSVSGYATAQDFRQASSSDKKAEIWLYTEDSTADPVKYAIAVTA